MKMRMVQRPTKDRMRNKSSSACGWWKRTPMWANTGAPGETCTRGGQLSINFNWWLTFILMNIYTINPVKFISRTSLITWWYIIKFRVYFKQKETRIIHRLKLSFNFYGWLTSILWNSFPEQAFNNIMIIKFRVYFWTKGNKNHG